MQGDGFWGAISDLYFLGAPCQVQYISDTEVTCYADFETDGNSVFTPYNNFVVIHSIDGPELDIWWDLTTDAVIPKGDPRRREQHSGVTGFQCASTSSMGLCSTAGDRVRVFLAKGNFDRQYDPAYLTVSVVRASYFFVLIEGLRVWNSLYVHAQLDCGMWQTKSGVESMNEQKHWLHSLQTDSNGNQSQLTCTGMYEQIDCVLPTLVAHQDRSRLVLQAPHTKPVLINVPYVPATAFVRIDEVATDGPPEFIIKVRALPG